MPASRIQTLLALFLFLSSCRPTSDRPPADASKPDTPPSIVLVSIDTLRADRLPAWGYGGVETPAIDRLRERSILFRNAYSPVPLTGPAHTSLFTGLEPHRHGVRDNIGYRLPEDLPWLPQVLRDAGYRTLGAASAVVLEAASGWNRGFDVYDTDIRTRVGFGRGGVQRTGQSTLEAIRPPLEDALADTSRPFFLFLHLYDPHTPWAAPEPHASRWSDPYDAEIAAVDEVVGHLLDLLASHGDRPVAILLTSDHGEGLGDHGEREHGVLLYREALHVPLLLALPDGSGAGSEIADPAGLIDVLPTLLNLAGVEVPQDLSGVSLLSPDKLSSRSPLLAETWYPRLHFGWSELSAAIEGNLHYIRGPRPELYDMGLDPAERDDLSAQRRGVVRRLDSLLAENLTAPDAPEEASSAALAELRALGYLGGASQIDDGPLPHPVDRVGVLIELDDAIAALGNDRLPEAIDGFEAIVQREPGLVDAWEYLAKARTAVGDLNEALAAYVQGIEITRGSPHLVVSAAGIEARRGDWAAALDIVTPWLDVHPDEIRLRFVASQACLRTGDLQAALDHADAALRIDPESADALYQRGSVAIGLGQLQQAERWLRQALERAPEHPAARSDLEVLLRHLEERGDAPRDRH